ncbi:MAG: response regulator transcription factor [Actinomycetota bacterium]
MTTRILLIDDDPKIVGLLRRGLAYEGFDVYTASDGAGGQGAVRSHRPHIVLLDIAMPGMDGFEVCRRLRLESDVAIIMLTARDDVADKVSALDLGADDYMPKPFAFDELLARIRAVLRRRQEGGEPLVYADVSLNPSTHEVRRGDRPVELTATEYGLLLLFLRHPRQVLTREQILSQVWGFREPPDTSVLDVHVGHLRRKLEAGDEPRLIHTIRGIGYALRA